MINQQQRLAPYVFISPFFILFLIFAVFPIGYSITMSFFKWTISGPHRITSYNVCYTKLLRTSIEEDSSLRRIGRQRKILRSGIILGSIFTTYESDHAEGQHIV